MLQGALALEDALSKGLPIEKEIEAVRSHGEGIDKDSLIALVLSSLPEDTKKYGTDTLSQLKHKASYLYVNLMSHFPLFISIKFLDLILDKPILPTWCFNKFI